MVGMAGAGVSVSQRSPGGKGSVHHEYHMFRWPEPRLLEVAGRSRQEESGSKSKPKKLKLGVGLPLI